MEEEINYDIMRYELDDNGYITSVFFGCSSGTCGAYEGEVPEGYIDLEDWYESNCNILNAWFISDGNLVYDAARASSLQERYAKEENENGLVHRHEIYGLEEKINQNNEVLKEQFIKETITNKLIEVDNSKALSPNIKLNNVSGIIEIVSSNKNVMPNDATTQTISGIVFEQNYDRSITLNGTSTEAIEYNIAGSSSNTTSIFVFKKDVEYYLSSNDYQIIMYNFDGVEREEVYSGVGGAITFNEDRYVTQIVLCVPNETTLTDVLIQPQLELGTSSTEYAMHEEYSLVIDLTDITNIEYVNVLGNEVYIKTTDNEEEYYADGYLGMHEGYNVVYALQDAALELTYYTNAFNVEFEVENLEFMQGKGTKHNQFRILEDGSMEAHNGNFSGVITASEGEIGGFTLGATKFTSSIKPTYDFTQSDLDKISNYLLGGTLTEEELIKYDVNEDGEVDILDFRLIKLSFDANVTATEPGSLEINSKSPYKTILLKDKDGNEFINIGMLGVQVNGKNVLTQEKVAVSDETPMKGEEVWLQKSRNLFNKHSAMITGFTYDTNGGTAVLENCFIQKSFIPVSPYTKYTISTTNDYTSLSNYRLVICEYDAYKNFIKRNINWGITSYSITTTDETRYVRLCATTDTLEELQFEEGDETPYSSYINNKLLVKEGNDYKEFKIEPSTGTTRAETVSGSYVRLFTLTFSAIYKSTSVWFTINDTQATHENILCNLYAHKEAATANVQIIRLKYLDVRGNFDASRLVAVVTGTNEITIFFKMNNNDSPTINILSQSRHIDKDEYGLVEVDTKLVQSALPSGTQIVSSEYIGTDTGWVNATLTSDFKLYNSSSYCRYRKIGKQVNIQFTLSPASASNVLNSATETTAFTLPEAFRPSQNLNALCQGSGTNIFTVGVNTSGNVNIYRYRNSSSYSSTAPGTSTWLPFNITYFVD